MQGIIRVTIIDTIPLVPVAAGGDTLDTQVKAAGYPQGETAIVGFYIGGVAGNLVYESYIGATRTLPVIANQSIQLRARRILSTSTATVMFVLIGDM